MHNRSTRQTSNPAPAKTAPKPTVKEREGREAARGKGNPDELKLCGFNACMRLFSTRAEDIIRVYVTEPRMEACTELIKSCARRRKAYHVVASSDLDKISGSTHHEGVCIIAKRRPPLTWDGFLRQIEENPEAEFITLILEDVENPHNVGAIVRTAAHFGCFRLILPNEKSYKPSAALLRTAEGGGETVELISAPQISVVATELKHRGVTVLGTATQGRLKLFAPGETGKLPERAAIILGNEARGMSAASRKAAAGLISIPGSGAVESLNVGVAAALILGEYSRQRGVQK